MLLCFRSLCRAQSLCFDFLGQLSQHTFPLYIKLSGDRLCNFCAGFAWPPFNPLQKLCQSCAAGSLEQDLCSPVLLSLVSYRNLVRILCPSLACNRMCKVCEGRAWAFSSTLDRLCESCAARFLVQGSCSFAFVPSVSCVKLVRQPCFLIAKTVMNQVLSISAYY